MPLPSRTVMVTPHSGVRPATLVPVLVPRRVDLLGRVSFSCLRTFPLDSGHIIFVLLLGTVLVTTTTWFRVELARALKAVFTAIHLRVIFRASIGSWGVTVASSGARRSRPSFATAFLVLILPFSITFSAFASGSVFALSAAFPATLRSISVISFRLCSGSGFVFKQVVYVFIALEMAVSGIVFLLDVGIGMIFLVTCESSVVL